MPKIDTSGIKGYDKMTPEEKLAALEAYEYEDNAGELERNKAAVSKANSEAAEWKRKYNDKLSEEERKAAESAEALESMKTELASLRRDKTIADYTAKFLALGYDATLAGDTAAAFADGDTAKVIANQQRFLEAHDKTLKAELLKGGSTPPAGSEGGSAMTLEKFRAMSDEERYKFSTEHPDDYHKLYGGT